jgi:hypothetical protein
VALVQKPFSEVDLLTMAGQVLDHLLYSEPVTR